MHNCFESRGKGVIFNHFLLKRIKATWCHYIKKLLSIFLFSNQLCFFLFLYLWVNHYVSTFSVSYLSIWIDSKQILAKRGPASEFVTKAKHKPLISKSNSRLSKKWMVQGQKIQPQSDSFFIARSIDFKARTSPPKEF